MEEIKFYLVSLFYRSHQPKAKCGGATEDSLPVHIIISHYDVRVLLPWTLILLPWTLVLLPWTIVLLPWTIVLLPWTTVDDT